MSKNAVSEVREVEAPKPEAQGISFATSDLQVGADEIAQIRGTDDVVGKNDAMSQFPSADQLFNTDDSDAGSLKEAQYVEGDRAQSPYLQPEDPERMKSVDRNTNEVNERFKDAPDGVKDAAYRYLMHRECVDNYQSSLQDDMETLEKYEPGTVTKLDKLVDERASKGSAPGSKCIPMS